MTVVSGGTGDPCEHGEFGHFYISRLGFVEGRVMAYGQKNHISYCFGHAPNVEFRFDNIIEFKIKTRHDGLQ